MAIDLTVQDGIAVITINRPDRLNALDVAHFKLLAEAFSQVRDDPAIRVAVLTGTGERAFCVGADLKSGAPKTELSELWLTQRDFNLHKGLEIWKPVIAAVNGQCLGGGMTLLLATDIRFAASHVTFGLPEVKRGLIAASGGTQRVLSQLPHVIGMQLLLTGDAVSAETALRWNLVNDVVPADRLMETALDCARQIAANAPLAVQASKELAMRSREMDRVTGLRFEQLTLRMLQFTEDAAEGPKAFTEKRPADFKGR